MSIISFISRVINKVKRVIKEFYLCVKSCIFDIQMKLNNYVVSIKTLDINFYLPYYKTDYIQGTILQSKNYYERKNLDFICKEWKGGVIGQVIKESYVLDIGANIGNHTLYYLNECNALGVYCFEPIQDTFNMLKKNIEINNLNNYTYLYNVGVGMGSGNAKIGQYDINNIGGSTIELTNDGDIKVVSIDELEITAKIGLVKMDVEGFEISALNGMLNTIKKNMPYISIEIRDYNKEEACSLLKGLGYKYIELDKEDVYSDYLFYV